MFSSQLTMMMMSSVAAIRQKFQEQDIILSPSPTLPATVTNFHGRNLPKHESPSKSATNPQRTSHLKPTAPVRPPPIKFQKNPNAENKTSTIGGHGRGVGTTAAKVFGATKQAELNRSSSLTDVTTDCDTSFKRSESITSLSTSDDALSKKLNHNVVSEIKSLFEFNNRNVPPSDKPADKKPRMPNSKPSLAISGRHLNSQGYAIKKADVKNGGSEIIQPSPSSTVDEHLTRDVSPSISMSTSSLGKMSANDVAFDRHELNGGISMCAKMELPTLPVKRVCCKRHLPNLLELGPPPPKPLKPQFLRGTPVCGSSCFRTSSPQETIAGKSYPSVNFSIGLPPKRPPPKPPSENGGKPLPPLPLQEDFYDDSQNADDVTSGSNNSSGSGQFSRRGVSNGQCDELYNDIANEPELEDDIYETMEVDPSQCDHYQRHSFQERKLSNEFRENEKEMLKLKEKFQLTGDELAIAKGKIKKTTRGKGNDLAVKEGEHVVVYRTDRNPTGRWLVKNEKGKVGYVELNNIEMDPQFVKSIMQMNRYGECHYQTPRCLMPVPPVEEEEDLYQDVSFLD